MSAQPGGDNVRPLRPLTPAQHAMTEARTRPEKGHLDALLADEKAKPADPRQAAIAQLIATGDAMRLSEAAWPNGVVSHLLDETRRAERERDQARHVAVALEQQAAEIERLARKWAGMKSGQVAGVGNVLLDILAGQPETDHAA